MFPFTWSPNRTVKVLKGEAEKPFPSAFTYASCKWEISL